MTLLERPLRLRYYAALVALVIGTGLWFRVHVLDAGFMVDDYAQLAMMTGHYDVPRAPLALFTFSNGERAENERLRASGFFPWWSHPELRVSLLRPLACALMWFDLRVFGANPLAYHLHSACWWLALLVVWATLLRQLMPPRAALLALATFTAYPAHSVLLGWIAGRNALVASTFALLGLYFQLRAQREGWTRGFRLALIAYALSLSAGEYAAGFLGYGVLLSLHAPGSRRLQLRAAGSIVGLLLAYALVRWLLGFGTRHSGMYIDPLAEPLAFARAALERVPILAGDVVLCLRAEWWTGGAPFTGRLVQWLGLPERFALDLSLWRALLIGPGVLALAIVAAMGGMTRRRAPCEPHAGPSFAAWGLPLTLLLSAASLPESRLLLPALFGWLLLLIHALRVFAGAKNGRLGLAAVLSLWSLQTFGAPFLDWDNIHQLPRLVHAIRASILAPALDAVLTPGRHALLLGAVDPTTTIYIPLARSWHGRPSPRSCQLLSSSYAQQRLTRLGPNSFTLERLQTYLTAPEVYGFAFNRHALHVGERFDAEGLHARIERTIEGRAARVRFDLDVALDDPSIVLITQTPLGLQPLAFPAIGASVVLEPAVAPFALMPPESAFP